MVLFNDEVMSDLCAHSTEPHTYPELTSGKGPGSTEAKYVKWLTFKDENAAVIEDVQRIARHPLIPKGIKIYGYIYDVHDGLIKEVAGARKD